MPYVDGFLIAVPSDRKEDYRRMAEEIWPAFRKYGALSTMECWGDDVPDGKLTSFPMAVKLEPGETVVFSWIVWPDKAARDRCMASMRDDPDFAEPAEMIFDGKRMIFGGFEPIFEA